MKIPDDGNDADRMDAEQRAAVEELVGGPETLPRTALLLSVVLLGEGLALLLFPDRLGMPLDEAPRFLHVFVRAMGFVLPPVGLLGIVGSVAMKNRLRWGRSLLAYLLYVGVVLTVVFGAAMFVHALGTPEDEFRKGKAPTLIMVPVVTMLMSSFLGGVARYLSKAEA